MKCFYVYNQCVYIYTLQLHLHLFNIVGVGAFWMFDTRHTPSYILAGDHFVANVPGDPADDGWIWTPPCSLWPWEHVWYAGLPRTEVPAMALKEVSWWVTTSWQCFLQKPSHNEGYWIRCPYCWITPSPCHWQIPKHATS